MTITTVLALATALAAGRWWLGGAILVALLVLRAVLIEILSSGK